MLKCRSNKVRETKIDGVEVGKRADALFFLHAFHREGAVSNWERQAERARQRHRAPPEPPTVFQYVVHYTDGETVAVPVRYGEEVASWFAVEPEPLPGASIAWSAPLSDASGGERAVVYSMQWDNPRPEATIASIDIVSVDSGKWGAPAVFAVTAGSTR